MHMPRSAAALGVSNNLPVSQDRIARKDGRLQRNQPLMRKYEVAHLTKDGLCHEFQKTAPAHPLFEEAFSAFARGLLFQTENGPIAVEDLWPGDRIRTANGRLRTLMWKGSMMIVPHVASETTSMIRVGTEALGLHRPSHDTMFGPSARVFHTSPRIRAFNGQDGAFVPLADLVDGDGIIEITPMAPVQVFHLGFATHERLSVAGLEVESYHPGAPHRFPLRGKLLDMFMPLFPHMRDLGDFGMDCQPRLRMADLTVFDVA
ncbi:MAG: Hint domain-containing protein [Marivivens sp.]|uniref:Hint domain-containing protein n=1 Tax=Marivivens sp. TaxID=1978374 RepID=UPI0018493885|nr:Hint domain-containing protein [Marivivens sp.]NVJ94150.1 Hint domain-containing protein [Marivivens sp.]